jgi:hypothetical protein
VDRTLCIKWVLISGPQVLRRGWRRGARLCGHACGPPHATLRVRQGRGEQMSDVLRHAHAAAPFRDFGSNGQFNNPELSNTQAWGLSRTKQKSPSSRAGRLVDSSHQFSPTCVRSLADKAASSERHRARSRPASPRKGLACGPCRPSPGCGSSAGFVPRSLGRDGCV